MVMMIYIYIYTINTASVVQRLLLCKESEKIWLASFDAYDSENLPKASHENVRKTSNQPNHIPIQYQNVLGGDCGVL